MGKKAPKAPAPPDPYATAAAQGAADKEVARVNQRGSMVDQYTPYGSLVYTDLGDDRYRADVTLDPAQQQLMQLGNQSDIGLAQMGLEQMGRVQGALNQPFQPETFTPGGAQVMPDLYQALHDNYSEHRTHAALPTVRDTQYYADLMQQREAPRMRQQREDLRTQMINQGIREGTEAWQRGMDDYNRGVNDFSIGAQLAAGQEQSRQYGLDQSQYATKMSDRATALDELRGYQDRNTAERQRQIQEAAYFRQLPMNEVAALMSGAQIQGPQFQNTPGYNQPNSQIGNYIYGNYQGQLQNYNTQVQQQTANRAGLFGLLGAGMGAAGLYFGGR